MKLYRWTVGDMAEQLKRSKAAVERTHKRVAMSLESLQHLQVSVMKMACILERQGSR